MLLPRLVNPRKLVATNATFTRDIDVNHLPRLQEATLSITRVFVDVQLERDEQHRPQLVGKVEASFELECQRCLSSMPVDIDHQFRVVMAWDEIQEKALPKNLDAWIVGDEDADLCAILEEEILLLLPVVPKHDSECLEPKLFQSGEGVDSEAETKENPFSVLAELKGDSE